MFSLEDKRAIMQRKHIYNCSYYGKCNPSAHIVIEVDVERGPIMKEGVPWSKKITAEVHEADDSENKTVG